MAKLIHKINLDFITHEDVVVVNLPKGSVILNVDYDNKLKQIVMWYIFNKDSEKLKEDRHIVCFWTGGPIPENYELKEYLGTVRSILGLVYHIFEFEIE